MLAQAWVLFKQVSWENQLYLGKPGRCYSDAPLHTIRLIWL